VPFAWADASVAQFIENLALVRKKRGRNLKVYPGLDMRGV
jgi:hypothetical protein